MVSTEWQGTYRQVTKGLRIQRGAGHPDKVSERPRDPRTGAFRDVPPAPPTLIELDELDQFDVPALIAIGGIVRVEPVAETPAAAEAAEPPAPRRRAPREGTDG